MNLKKTCLFIFLVIQFFLGKLYSQDVTVPYVQIKDHITPVANTGIINIDCNYEFLSGNKIQLTAEFPEIRQPSNYQVESINYKPIGNYSDGAVVDIKKADGKEDDTFSGVIDLPFTFCFYGNKYSQIIISDNGVLSFNTSLSRGECPYAPPTPVPNGLPRNSIFGVFHDMLNIKEVRYYVEGLAPNRRLVVNYNNIPQYGYGMPGKNSTSQIVLYETSNIIDVYVKDRYENLSTNKIFEGAGAYRKNAVIGLTNYDSSNGVAAPGRDSGNWEAHNEAWRFIPSGNTNHTIIWRNMGSEISGTRNQKTITVQPSGDTKYQVEVTYNLCVPQTVKDEIEVKFSQEFPTAKEVTTEAFCVDNGESYTVDLTQYETEMNPDPSLTFSYFEDAGLNTPISYPETAYVYSNNKIVYVKVLKSGVCYTIGRINLKINKRPVIPAGQPFELCDTDNDEKEIIKLGAFSFSGVSGTYYKFFETQAEAIAGTPEINKDSYVLDVTGEPNATKTLYMRAWNSTYNDSECYTVVPFTVKLKKYIKLKEPEDPFLICYVTEGQVVKDYDLTQYQPHLIDFPASGLTFEYYTHSSYGNQYKIQNPVLATFTMNPVIYIKATAPGYCDGFTKIELMADDDCDGAPGGGGGSGPGGPGGPGGGGGAICNSNETEYTVNLDQDYLRFFLLGGLTLADIDIIGFYDSTTNALITDTAPYPFTFPVPYFKVIQARYKVKATGMESYVNFPVSASGKALINPDTFDICDTYKEGKGVETVQLIPEYESILNALYLNSATIRFFKTHQDLVDYNNDNSLKNDITQIELNSPLTTVYVWVKFFGCIYEHEIYFNLIPVDERILNPPYVVCDFNDDKKEIVNIIEKTNQEADIKNVLTPAQVAKLKLPIRYYRTVEQASTSPANYITNPTGFEINLSQMSVFARLEIEDECPVFVEIQFTFTTSVNLPDYKAKLTPCDENNDKQEIGFDLNEVIISKDPDSEISFYTREDAALSGNISFKIGGNYDGITPISYDITTIPATVYMRVYDKNTGCVAIFPVEITLIGYPEITNNIITWCDYADDGTEEIGTSEIQKQLISNNAGILYPPPAMTYKFFATEAEAKADVTPSLISFQATRTNSVWVRIMKDVGDCPMIFELKFNLIKPPVLSDKILTYTICNNNTGNENGQIKEIVNLDMYKNEILGFPATNDYKFSYYDSSENDAIAGGNIGKISTNYTITSFPKTIWVRVEYGPTGCFSVKAIVFDQYPTLENDVTDTEIIACAAGELSKIIDLTDYPPQMILPHVNLSDFDISYHTSRENAVNGVPITSDITNYTVTPASQIWIKFVDKRTGGTNCYIIKKLNVTIYSTPKAQDYYPQVCDESDGVLDGRFVIPNLDDYRTYIMPGESLATIENLYPFTYYTTFTDADQGMGNNKVNKINFTFNESDLLSGGPLNADTYELYARIDKNDNTGCYEVVTIYFQVNKKVPVNPVQPEILGCDEPDNDGKTRFDLTSVKDQISTTSGISFKYYPTGADARNNTREITNVTNWMNTTPYEHIVYVRVSAPDKCDAIASIKLIVYPYIKAENHDIGNLCEFVDGSGAETRVDLTSYLPQILINVDPTMQNDLLVSFHTSLPDAESNSNSFGVYDLLSPVADPALTNYLPAIGATTLYLRFTSKTRGCFTVKELTMNKLKAPEINDIGDVLICDDNLNLKFDDIILNSLDGSLIANPANYTIIYHTSLSDAWTNTGLIDKNSKWEVLSYPQTIAVRIVDNATGCVNTREIHFITNPKVLLRTDEVLIEQCDDNDITSSGFNDGKSEFNLTLLEDQLVRSSDLSLLPAGGTLTFTYYTNQIDASRNQNPIPNPQAYTNSNPYLETVYVRISADGYCDNRAVIQLRVYPSILAENHDIGNLCEFVDGSGAETRVDLTSYLPQMLTNIDSTMQNDLLVSFHTSLPDAESNSNSFGVYDLLSPVPDPALTNYLPAIGATTLYLRFTSKTRGCFTVKELTMNKLKAPETTPVSYVICDDDLDDVFFIVPDELDTSGFIANPSSYILSYHLSDSEAWRNQNSLPAASRYIITSFTTDIFVRVVDRNTGCVNVEVITIATNPKINIINKEVDLVACDGDDDGYTTFDLSLVQSDISAETNSKFIYFSSLQDAQNNQNPITNFNTYTNKKINQDYVYVRVEEETPTGTRCPSLAKIRLLTYYPPRVLPEVVYICPRDDSSELDAGVFDEWEWRFEGKVVGNEQYYTAENIGIYTVTVTKYLNYGLSCSTTFTVEVKPLEDPVILELKQGKDYITVLAKGPEPLEYSIDKKNWQRSNTFTNLEPGIYTFYVRSTANGCEAITSRGIIFGVPNAITPNGDGYNDVWRLCGLHLFSEPSHIKIFDRYGKEVFTENSSTCFVWDGKHLGRNLPTSSYWYIITIADGRKYTGWILLRNYDESHK